MLGIGSFFERWKSYELEKITFYTTIIDTIKEVLEYDVAPSRISYSNNIIILKIPPSAKNAVMIKKGELIKKIQERTNKNILDIK